MKHQKSCQSNAQFFLVLIQKIIEPGAKLIIDGGQLRSLTDEPWPGIEVWGNSSAHQYADANGNYQQGYVELRNGAVIENAWEAIQPWKPGDFQKTSGIIVAKGATFKNNRRAVQFISYQNFDPQTGDPRPNQSYFSDCTFETTEEFDGLFGNRPFSTFVSMWKVDGIKFLGCDFIDSRTDFYDMPNVNQSIGIWTVDANFYVLPRCIDAITTCWECTQNDLDFSSFTGLNIALLTSQDETVNTFVVDRTDFISNLMGIYVEGNDFSSCIRSDFEVSTKQLTGPYYYSPIGILNLMSSGFTFDQNDFTVHSSLPQNIDFSEGIRNMFIGAEENILFGNSFTNLGYGIISQGNNRNPDYEHLGLNYRCNDNSGNLLYDFYVTQGIGIAIPQGTEDKAAGNTFSQLTANDYSDFNNDTPEKNTYYYDDGPPDEEPLNFSGLEPETADPNSCTDRYGTNSDIRLTETEKTAYRQQYYENKAEYDNAKALPGTPEDVIAGYAYLWGDACNNLVRDIVLDSMGIQYDSLRLWLENKESLQAAYKIVDSYLAEDDFTNALTYLNTIPDSFDLSGEQLEEYGYFHDLKTTFITAHQQGRNIMQLDSLEVLDLVAIADTSKGLAGVQAQSLLNFAYGYNYFDLPALPDPGSKSSRVQDQGFQDDNITGKPHFVTAYPNPAKSWVTFDYTLPPPAESATIVISDVTGKQIGIVKVNRSFGQTVWDTRGVSAGIYFYSLEVNGNVIDKRKLIISK